MGLSWSYSRLKSKPVFLINFTDQDLCELQYFRSNKTAVRQGKINFCSKLTVDMIRDGSAEVHFSAFPPLDMIETGIWIQRVQKRANEMYQCCYYKKLDFSSSV